MLKSTLLRKTAVAVAVIGATAAVGVSSASAGWSTPGPYKEAGTLTLKLNGGSPVSCSFDVIAGNLFLDTGVRTCSNGGSWRMYTSQIAQYNGGAPNVRLAGAGMYLPAPWGTNWGQTVSTPPVVNGNPSTPTRIVLSDTVIGNVLGQPLTATGDITITTPNGGLVTVVP